MSIQDLINRLTEGLLRFYEANRQLLAVLWQAFVAIVTFLGGFVGWVAFGALILVLTVIAWISSGIEERILRRLVRIRFVGWVFAIIEVVLYYLTVIAVETASLLLPFPQLNTWAAIGIVVSLNALTMAWHAKNKRFFPKWVTNGFTSFGRRLRPAKPIYAQFRLKVNQGAFAKADYSSVASSLKKDSMVDALVDRTGALIVVMKDFAQLRDGTFTVAKNLEAA